MIRIFTLPFLADEEEWINDMEKQGGRLVAVTLHSISNEVRYYFFFDVQ